MRWKMAIGIAAAAAALLFRKREGEALELPPGLPRSIDWELVLEAVILQETQLPFQAACSSINLDDNGAGISYGCIQFNQGSGSLGQLLSCFQNKNRALFSHLFDPAGGKILQVLTSPDRQTRLSYNMRVWREELVEAGTDPKMQSCQRALALELYAKPVPEAMEIAGLSGTVGAGLVFDRSVNFGPGTLAGIAYKAKATSKQGVVKAWIDAASSLYPSVASKVRARQLRVLDLLS